MKPPTPIAAAVILALVGLGAAPAAAAEPALAPAGLHVTVIGPTSIQWAWEPVPNAARYRVAISRSRTMSDPEIKWVAGRWTTAQLLPRSTTFYAAVRAETAAGLSAASDVVTGRTSPVPTGLHLTERTATKLTWAWTEYKNSPRYEIQISPSSDFVTRRVRITTGGSGTSFFDLDADRRYYVRVRGINQDWTPFTHWSSTVHVTTLG